MLEFIYTVVISLIFVTGIFSVFQGIADKYSEYKKESKKFKDISSIKLYIDSSFKLKSRHKIALHEKFSKLSELKDKASYLSNSMSENSDYRNIVIEIDSLILEDFVELIQLYELVETPHLYSSENQNIDHKYSVFTEYLNRIPKSYYEIPEETVEFEGDISSTVLSKSLSNNSNKLKSLLNNDLLSDEDKDLINKQIAQIDSYLLDQKNKVHKTTIGDIRNDLQINQKYLDSLEVFWLD